MSIKQYDKKNLEEHEFVLGIDLGDSTSAIAYYDSNRNSTEVIDMSGGYGKPSAPTALQYVSDTEEWIFGEYALLNRGHGNYVPIENLLDKLLGKEYIAIGGRPIGAAQALGVFIKELLNSIKNINPKAEIKSVGLASPAFIKAEGKQGLTAAMKYAGITDKLMTVTDIECIFRYCFHNAPPKRETALLLDYGSRELRGGVYEIDPSEDEIGISCLASYFDGSMGTGNVNQAVNRFLTALYCENMKQPPSELSWSVKEQLFSFCYQHKDLLFQKNISQKPVKLYYNFAYPPFQKTITSGHMEELLRPYRQGFAAFMDKLFSLCPGAGKEGINRVICVGGGFEMLWARNAIGENFGEKAGFFRNAKAIAAQGAALYSAEKMGLLPRRDIVITDLNRIPQDIGMWMGRTGKEAFLPVIEKDSYWWQQREPVSLIVTEAVTGDMTISLYKKEGASVTPIGEMNMSGLPERPAGVTRLGVSLHCQSASQIKASVWDLGFGEFFPAEGYKENFIIDI